MTERPDQLDVQVAIATANIRRQTNEARARLGLPQVDYPFFETHNPEVGVCADCLDG
jgi:hypothetical protein